MTDPLTFDALTTPVGVVAAAALITAVVELLKRSAPAVNARFSGALQAFVLSAALYTVTALVLRPPNADGYLVVFLAWLSCATSAVGIHGTAHHAMAQEERPVKPKRRKRAERSVQIGRNNSGQEQGGS